MHYSEIDEEPTKKVVDLDTLYSTANSDFSAEEFLEESLSKEIDILEGQLASCREELKERKELHESQVEDLKSKAQEYRSALTSPIKMRELVTGDDLQEQKANLSEKIGAIEERIREETRENWKDRQKLKEQVRELEKEIEKMKKRKKFMQFYSQKL